MPEKYRASRENNDETNTKIGKIASKMAADHFTDGKGGKVVDKLGNSKLGNAAFKKMGNSFMKKNPGFQKIANKLNDSGALDLADKGLSLKENSDDLLQNPENISNEEIGNSVKSDSGKDFLSKGKSGFSALGGLLNSNNKETNDSSSNNANIESNVGIEIFGIKPSAKVKIIVLVVGFCFFFLIAGCFLLFSSTDENGTNPDQLHSDSGSTSCISNDNLQASDLCKLRNEGKFHEWVNQFGSIAQQDYSRTGVFASITIAQAMIESAWGCSDIHNNLFGVKCHNYHSCTTVGTHEEYNGSLVAIRDSFRIYPNVYASIEDHSKFLLENSIYTNNGVFSASDYKEQARALQRAGYATASNYAETLINQIKFYDLSRFDVTVNTTSSSECVESQSLSGWKIRTTAPTSSDAAFNRVSSNRGQCVWYARARAIEIVEDLEKKGKIDSQKANTIINKLLVAYGNGGDWYDNTRGVFKGSNNIKKVKPGSIISWKKPGGYGHVAVVEDITGKKIKITEGYSNQKNSCPTNWSCVSFVSRTMSLDDFYSFFAPYYAGTYIFSGYVYFLELEE